MMRNWASVSLRQAFDLAELEAALDAIDEEQFREVDEMSERECDDFFSPIRDPSSHRPYYDFRHAHKPFNHRVSTFGSSARTFFTRFSRFGC
jgi:hypothetical protein